MADRRRGNRTAWRGRARGNNHNGFTRNNPQNNNNVRINNAGASGQHEQGNGEHRRFKNVAKVAKPMSERRMRELETRPATEVMFSLMDHGEGFLKLIVKNDLNLNQMMSIISLLSRACDSEQRESLKLLLKSVQDEKQFMIVNAQSYLCELQNHPAFTRREEASLINFVNVLEILQQLDPRKSLMTLGMLLPQLKETLRVLDERAPPDLSNRIRRLEEENNSTKEIYSVPFLCNNQVELPPDDFRAIPLFPDAKDLKGERPFLRPNIIDGRYQDTEHYLDVQFRLLREDFVRPLREGIASYIRQTQNQEKRLKIQDLRVYNNVRIMDPKMTRDGVIYDIHFDVAPFRRIRWETNKRLIFGSLLCFSHNNFETMIFGTVAIRKPEDLTRGVFSVRIEDHHAIPEMRTVSFVMLETTAYFEAYRYNLLALQSMDETNLSFREYIVEVSPDICSPLYITKKEGAKYEYCLQPLLAYNNTNLPKELFEFAFKKCCVEPRYCEILDNGKWPSNEELGLDQSQYKALKMALTKKLAIIQGPPGTGKTYVGLKIIQALLHNSKEWNCSNKGGQILVICYTNHALDQFLEGVLKYTSSVVRIGGRCKNEQLGTHTLRDLKRSLSFSRRREQFIHRNDRDVQHELEEIVERVDSLQTILKESKTSLISEDDLEPVISEEHLDSLRDFPRYMYITNPVILCWLGFAMPDGYHQPIFDTDEECSDPETAAFQVPEPIPLAPEEEMDEDGGDIEYENDLRMDGGEFEDARAIRLGRRDRNPGLKINFLNIAGDSDVWQVQGGKKQQRKFMLQNLRKCKAMTAEEMELIKDVWNLSFTDRRRMYKAWIEWFQIHVKSKIEELNQEYQNKLKVAIELSCEEDFLISKSRQVIGMTTTGAAKYRSLVRRLKPQIIIVEEAAEVLEAHIVTALTEETQHLILIGDHQQLRPNPTVYELAKRFKLDVSLFERLVKNGLPFCTLGIQHRMKPCISKLLVPHIYESLEDHDSVKKYENIKGVEKSMFFINHNIQEISERDSTSRINLHEAEYLMRLCRHLLLQGYHQSHITILATYTGQFLTLKNLMTDPMYKGVRITVVDNFQGEENDIILLSLVRSNEEGSVGFLKVDNRVCVALSRAKKGLYCIGNFDLLKQKSSLWENIRHELICHNEIGQSLNLCCQNHGNVVSITKPEDFDSVINGGCSISCDFRLDCGHSCSLRCHPYDKDHEEYKCTKICDKVICGLQHRCPKLCSLPCGPCKVVVPKLIPSCGHEVRLACHVDPTEVKCSFPCPKVLDCGHNCHKQCSQSCGECDTFVTVASQCGHDVRLKCCFSKNEMKVQENCFRRCERALSCGHPCPKLCGVPCVQACMVRVNRISPCGHDVQVLCHQKDDEEKLIKACQYPCRKELLECGHICAGTCSSCHQGRMHIPCEAKCGRLLVCGHVCNFFCSKNCPPCIKRCDNLCNHSRCRRPCGVPCTPCLEPCNWKCDHYKCTMKCSELCNRPPCKERCKKRLRCKHSCIGLCGEPCPKKCRLCNRDEVTEIFFGDEDEEHARFIELTDCRHIFEVDGLTKWVVSQESEEGIKLLSCPKCKTPIHSNLHFSNYIKECILKVEKVKLKRTGSEEQIKKKRSEIEATLMKDHAHTWELYRPSIRNLRFKREDSSTPTACTRVVTKIIERLVDKRPIFSLDLLMHMENLLTFIEAIKKLQDFLDLNRVNMGVLYIDHLHLNLAKVLHVMNSNFEVISNQLMEDIKWEFRRLILLANFVKNAEKQCLSGSNEAKELFTSTTNMLMSLGTPFREEQEKQVEDVKNKLRSILGSAVIGVSQEEKLQILKAMNLQQGHWYQCPNGHVYCIADCGGAMIESRCNECNAVIGGGNHRLRSDNRVATAMDGARFAAWSEHNNINNFDINGLE